MADLRLFINRKSELNFLSQDLYHPRNRSRLLLVSAPTGIGKSALVDQALQSIIAGLDYRISISIDKHSEFQDGYLIRLITRLIHGNAIKSKSYISILQFIQQDRFYENVANGLVKALFGYIKLNEFAEGYSETNKQIIENIKVWIGNDNELLDVCYRYILTVSQTHKIYLAVDNLQIVDKVSLGLLRDILINSSTFYVVGEYTYSDIDNSVSEILDFFKDESIDLNSLRLQKLDKSELLSAIENEKEILLGIIERSYEYSDGNLHKFKLLQNTTQLKNYEINLSSYNNVTTQLLNNLDDISLAILNIIQSHQSEVPKYLLELYLKYTPTFSTTDLEVLNQKVLDLHQLGLLKLAPSKVSIDHDSVATYLIKNPKNVKIQTVAIRNWIRLYQHLERNTLSYEIDYIDNLLWQISFILKVQSFEELPEVLEKLNQYISTSPTSNIVFQLDKIAESYKSFAIGETNIDIFKWLVVMYYRCGYSDRVVNLVSPALQTDTTVLLCYLAALSTISHNDVFETLQFLTFEKNSALYLGLILIEIRTLRSADNFKECKRLWMEHFEKGTYKNTSFQAGFLKYCTLAEHDDYFLRIRCLHAALLLFQQMNDNYGQISTCIALSRDSAYIGNFQDCKVYLEKAEELANKTIYPRYQLYNNRAVYDIISGNISQMTKDYINNSLRICTNGGDRLILLSNLLVIAIIEQETVYGYTLYMKLQKDILHDFDTKDTITHLCLYNCYRFALLLEDEEQANELLSFLNRLELRQDIELWKYLLWNTGENRYSSVVHKEYYPTFMLSWDIDYYAVLNNYQSEAPMLE